MHPTDKRTQFIELRAQGWSIHKIARTIEVPKSTLADWQKQEQPRIAELKQMADEAREEEMLEHIQRDHEKVSARLALVEQQLDEQLRAKIESLSLMELCRLSSALRSQLHKSKSGPFRTKPDDSKAPDVREVAPETKTEQNGTTSAESGTSTSVAPPLKSQISKLPLPRPASSQMEQNGTTATENGTPLASNESPAACPKPSTQNPLNHQLPPKPPAPPERMIGHKIDPSKIIGRKVMGMAS